MVNLEKEHDCRWMKWFWNKLFFVCHDWKNTPQTPFSNKMFMHIYFCSSCKIFHVTSIFGDFLMWVFLGVRGLFDIYLTSTFTWPVSNIPYC